MTRDGSAIPLVMRTLSQPDTRPIGPPTASEVSFRGSSSFHTTRRCMLVMFESWFDPLPGKLAEFSKEAETTGLPGEDASFAAVVFREDKRAIRLIAVPPTSRREVTHQGFAPLPGLLLRVGGS